jgi:hypothetical protein
MADSVEVIFESPDGERDAYTWAADNYKATVASGEHDAIADELMRVPVRNKLGPDARLVSVLVNGIEQPDN